MKSFSIVATIILRVSFTFSSIQQNQQCPIDEFPIQHLCNTDVACLSENFGKKVQHIVDPDTSVPLDMTSFVQYPTKGQRLILVPRNSDLTIRLDDNVAYQLRQRQQLNTKNRDDIMDVPLQMNGYTVLSQLSQEVIHQYYDSNHTIDRKTNEKQFSKLDSVPLLLKSHPGQALVPLQPDPIGGGFMLEQLDYIDMGIGPETDAIRILREPRVASWNSDITNDDIFRYALCTVDGSVLFVSSSQLKVGSPVTLTSWWNSIDGTEEIEITISHFVTNFQHRYPFIVNTDGSLSPVEAQHLVIGISRFPAVTLMERFSPHRLMFQNAESFWNAPAPIKNGTALVLKSHPGLAVVTYPRYRGAFGLINVMDVLVGPANNDTYRTFHLFSQDSKNHHEFSLRDAEGAYLVPMNLDLQLDVPLRMIKYNVSQSTAATVALSMLLLTGESAIWIVNLEGSISPLNAPHLALGCKYISDFVDKGFATKQRLTWPSNTIADDRNDKDVVQSTKIGNENRLIHGVVWFLIVEGYVRYIALIVAVVAIVFIKVVPLSIWTLLTLQLTLGTTASTFYAGFQVGSFLTKAMYKRLKKQNGQEAVQVR